MIPQSSTRPIKSLGQNFLVDPWIIHSIITAISPQPEQEIIEIGPGHGAITNDLLANCSKLLAIEIDYNLASNLSSNFAAEIVAGKLSIITQDVLTLDFSQLPLNYQQSGQDPINFPRVVGNLPYNISSPLIFKLFAVAEYFRDFHFLLQKEFVARLVAAPNTKDYGRLSVMAQYHADLRLLFDVAGDAFWPKPKVNSSLVHIVPHRKLPWVAKDYKLFSDIVKVAFSQRRKIITNSLKKYCTNQHLQKLEINPTCRAEQLCVADFVNIANSL